MEILDEQEPLVPENTESKDVTFTYANLFLFVVCIGILACSLFWGYDKYNNYAIKGLAIYFFTGVYLLVKNGSFIKSSYFNYSYAIFGAIIVGFMFRIMHWPGGNVMLLASFGALTALYGFFFSTKPNKRWPDFVKLGFLLSLLGDRALNLLRIFEYSDILQIFSVLALTLLLVVSVVKFNRD